MDKKFIENLKNERKAQGKTQEEVSKLLNIPVSSYANYEQGRREPDIKTLREICNILDVSADYLLETQKNI